MDTMDTTNITYTSVDDSVSQQSQRNSCKKRTVLIFSSLIFLSMCGILTWEHFAYKDVSPPDQIAVLRDICAVLLTFSLVIFVVIGGIIWSKRYVRMRETVYQTEQQRQDDLCAIRTLMIGGIFYLIAGLHIVASQFYYSWGRHHHIMPLVVEIINYISMAYFAMVTILILVAIIFTAPGEVCCLLCLLYS